MTNQEFSTSAAPTSAEFRQLIGLYKQGRLRDANAFGTNLYARYPQDSSLNHVVGVIKARMGDLDAALHHYDRALAEKPDYVEVHNNRGSVLHEIGKLDEAINSYREALRIKPDHFEAHNNLGNALIDSGKPEEALASFSRALQHNPELAEAYNNIGSVLRSMGRNNEAAQNYERAIQISPDYAPAYSGLGNALNDQGLHRQAVDLFRQSLQLQPGYAATHNDLGNALSDLGRHEEAMASYQAALKINPNFAGAYNNIGNALSEYGDQKGAVQAYSEAVRLQPEFAEAHNNLSKNKKFTADDKQLEQMAKRIAAPDVSNNERMYLSFALGKAYGDIDDFDVSFKFFSDGNRLRKEDLAYDIRADQEQFSRITSIFDDEQSSSVVAGDVRPVSAIKPIFIVGVPRSGTSLTEQILASHSQVNGAGELQTASRIMVPILRDMSAETTATQFAHAIATLREQYMSEASLRADSATFVTDKMPTNFKWIGFLLAAFPEARIINLQRDPVACCWSMFRMLFVGNGFTNDFDDLARYYSLYTELMAFWRLRFPHQIYDLNYEALTEDQEHETRKLLEYCELPWEPQVLEFYKTRRRVRTYSDHQVRRKMYTGSSDAWRKYEKHLGPLVAALDRKEST